MNETKINADEFSAAVKEAENSVSAFTHIFSKPINYNGKIINELTFNLDKLTGNDGIAIENELMAQGKPVVVPTLSGEYIIRIAARACSERIGSDIFGTMPLRDYNAIRSKVRSFLLKSEL